MNLHLSVNITAGYSSNSQKARVMSENWVESWIFCPNCGSELTRNRNNRPVADFYCGVCKEDYELKSKHGVLGGKIVNGAYSTMIKRLSETNNPNFFFMTYDKVSYMVENFFVIPKYFFTGALIEKRSELGVGARRAGWVGCNILLDKIPEFGKIFYVQNSQINNDHEILEKWRKTNVVKQMGDQDSKGWLFDVLMCLEKIKNSTFILEDVYQFEKPLQEKHPMNNNVRAKIRQQLQLLRDKGIVEFIGNGNYRLL
jgi:type II restriction enzyme